MEREGIYFLKCFTLCITHNLTIQRIEKLTFNDWESKNMLSIIESSKAKRSANLF